MKSITSDVKIYYNKVARAAAQKLRRRRERGCLPSFDWRKSLEALPVVIAARSYQRDFFASDLAAGLTEVCMQKQQQECAGLAAVIEKATVVGRLGRSTACVYSVQA